MYGGGVTELLVFARTWFRAVVNIKLTVFGNVVMSLVRYNVTNITEGYLCLSLQGIKVGKSRKRYYRYINGECGGLGPERTNRSGEKDENYRALKRGIF